MGSEVKGLLTTVKKKNFHSALRCFSVLVEVLHLLCGTLTYVRRM